MSILFNLFIKQTKLEKDLMRPLYDHYRKVKRILTKNTPMVYFYIILISIH